MNTITDSLVRVQFRQLIMQENPIF